MQACEPAIAAAVAAAAAAAAPQQKQVEDCLPLLPIPQK
jgi:hypothetical protein